jgi:hypothetical protein
MHQVINSLFAARDAAHKLHLGTKSFAKHIALGELYKGLEESYDEIAEVWMGANGQSSLPPGSDAEFLIIDGQPNTCPVVFINFLSGWASGVRAGLVENGMDKTHPMIINLWDELLSLIYRTKYKLENLA